MILVLGYNEVRYRPWIPSLSPPHRLVLLSSKNTILLFQNPFDITNANIIPQTTNYTAISFVFLASDSSLKPFCKNSNLLLPEQFWLSGMILFNTQNWKEPTYVPYLFHTSPSGQEFIAVGSTDGGGWPCWPMAHVVNRYYF